MLRDFSAASHWPYGTRHEQLSSSTAAAPTVALVSAPQVSLVVTTLDDVIDATDGVLSLREAIDLANASPGLDRITFDESLLGGTILLERGSLTITDDVVIDGDLANRGADSIVIDGGYGITGIGPYGAYGFTGFVVDGAEARFADLTIQNSGIDGIDVRAADIELERVSVTGTRSPGGTFGIRGDGALTLRDSSVTDHSGESGIGIAFTGDVLVERSAVEQNGGGYGGGMRVVGDTRIVDSSISGNGGFAQAFGVSVDGSLSIERSSFIGNGQYLGAQGTAIQIRGELVLSNSTIADSAVGVPFAVGRGVEAAAIGIGPDSTAEIVNTTLTGSRYAFHDSTRPDLGTGLYVTPGSTATVANSIIDDSVVGTISSNGANTFRDTTVDGASSGDRLGVRAEDLFAETTALRNTYIRAGVAADNGGATRTIALRDNPFNPALNRADPEIAPAIDQRGVARDNTPDIGAFELGGPSMPPPEFDRGLIVTTLADTVAVDGEVSLREAILTAEEQPGADTITFADGLGSGTLVLEQGRLRITDDLTIEGLPSADGTGPIRIDGNGAGGVLDIDGASVTLRSLAIENAAAAADDNPPDFGAAVRIVDATLELDDVALLRNGGAKAGAIIARNSDVAITGSRLEGNFGEVGAVYVADGALSLAESVVSGNRASVEFPLIGGVLGSAAEVTITSSAIVDNDGDGVRIDNGTLRVLASDVSGNAGRGISTEGSTRATITDSTIDANASKGVFASGDLVVRHSSITGNGSGEGFASYFGGGIDARSSLTVTDSTVAGNLNRSGAGGIQAIGFPGTTLAIVNSTIADNRTEEVEAVSTYAAGGIQVGFGIEGSIVNTTLTGNYGARLGTETILPRATAGGLEVGFGSRVELANSIIVGNELAPGTPGAADVVGTVESRGGNLLGQPAFPGAAASDATGISADAVFATTRAMPGGTAAGVLADNGGPTQTVALLDDPANPALDTADPAAAPPTDQRGFVRDAAPDIGAFELGAEPTPQPPDTLPPLAEKVPLADADILGAPRSLLTLVTGDAAISFVDEYAAFQNSLGVYLVGPDGTIDSPQWVFERVEHAEPSDLASDLARPGGGPLSPGDTVWLSELFDPADLGPGVEIGLFLVADGWTANPGAIFDVGTLEFRTGDAAARVTDTTPQLFQIAENGVERLVLGDIMHTVDAGSANPLSNTLNPGGAGQVTSGTLDGLFTVAFEDKPLAASDRDFNDAIVAIDLRDPGADLLAAAPAAGADLATLLVTAEVA